MVRRGLLLRDMSASALCPHKCDSCLTFNGHTTSSRELEVSMFSLQEPNSTERPVVSLVSDFVAHAAISDVCLDMLLHCRCYRNTRVLDLQNVRWWGESVLQCLMYSKEKVRRDQSIGEAEQHPGSGN